MADGQKRTDTPSDGPKKTGSGDVRLFSFVFIVIVGITLCCFVTSQGINAGTSVYINRLGGSATLAGIGAAVFSGSALIGRLIAGPLADSRSRILVITAGMITLFVGVVGAALSANLETLMIWRVLQGLGFSAATTASATAAADVLPVERLGEGIGYYGLGQAVAMSVGPAIAIALVSTDPPENLFWGLTVATVIGLVLCFFCRYEKHPETLPETSTYRRRAMEKFQDEPRGGGKVEGVERDGDDKVEGAERDGGGEEPRNAKDGRREGFASRFVERGAFAGGIPIMFISPAFGFGIFFVGLFGASLGVGNAGLFYTLSALSMIAVRLSSRAFMDRVRPIKLFAVACAAGLFCYGMLFFTSLGSFTGIGLDAIFYIAGVFYGLCLGMALPVNQTVAVKSSPAERWGIANGMFMLLFDVGIGIASVVWGITNDQVGFTFTIVCVMVLIAISFVAALVTYPKPAKPGE